MEIVTKHGGIITVKDLISVLAQCPPNDFIFVASEAKADPQFIQQVDLAPLYVEQTEEAFAFRHTEDPSKRSVSIIMLHEQQ